MRVAIDCLRCSNILHGNGEQIILVCGLCGYTFEFDISKCITQQEIDERLERIEKP